MTTTLGNLVDADHEWPDPLHYIYGIGKPCHDFRDKLEDDPSYLLVHSGHSVYVHSCDEEEKLLDKIREVEERDRGKVKFVWDMNAMEKIDYRAKETFELSLK